MLENPSHLHHRLIKFADQYSQWSDLRHVGVMCWMMVGLMAEGQVNLPKWIIDQVDTKAQIAQSTPRRCSRWVNNPRINPATLSSPVVKAVFASWRDPEIYLSFDTSNWLEVKLNRSLMFGFTNTIPSQILIWQLLGRILLVNIGTLLVQNQLRAKLFVNMACALPLRKISWMISPMVSILKTPSFVRRKLCLVCV